MWKTVNSSICRKIQRHKEAWDIWLGPVVREDSDLNNNPKVYLFILGGQNGEFTGEWCSFHLS